MAEYQQIEYRIGKDGKVTEKVIKGLCRHKKKIGHDVKICKEED